MALFKTTAELKGYYPARLTFDILDLMPVIEQVEQEYLVEQVLGEAQYNELETAYQAGALSPEQSALMDKCRPAVANLSIYHFTGIGNVEFTTAGLSVGSTDKKAPAAEWRTRDLERAVLRMGYRGLDVLIGFLTANASDYPTWSASEQAQVLHSGFVRSTQTFSGRAAIGNSGYLFRRVLPALRRVEDGAVQDTLCSTALRDELTTAITAGTLSASQRTLVLLCQGAAAHLAMADSIVELSLGVDERGIWTFASLVGGSTSSGQQPAADSRLQQLIDHHRRMGNGYLDKLRKELVAQAAAGSCPLYAASTCYAAATAEVSAPENNGPVGGFM